MFQYKYFTIIFKRIIHSKNENWVITYSSSCDLTPHTKNKKFLKHLYKALSIRCLNWLRTVIELSSLMTKTGNGCVIIKHDMLFWVCLSHNSKFFSMKFSTFSDMDISMTVFLQKKAPYMFGTTWMLINNGCVFIFRRANLLKQSFCQTLEFIFAKYTSTDLNSTHFTERGANPCTPQTNKTFMCMWCKQLLSEREEKHLSVWLIPVQAHGLGLVITTFFAGTVAEGLLTKILFGNTCLLADTSGCPSRLYWYNSCL